MAADRPSRGAVDQVEYYTPFRTGVGAAVVAVVFSAFPLYLVVTGPRLLGVILAVLAIPVLGFYSLRTIVQVVVLRRPFVVITGEGMRLINGAWVSWDDVASIAIVTRRSAMSSKGVIAIQLHRPQAYLAQLGPNQRYVAKRGMAAGAGPIRLPAESFRVPLEDVVATMHRFHSGLAVGGQEWPESGVDSSGNVARGRRDRWAAYRGLPRWQAVLAVLPLGLVAIGGLIGGGIGGVCGAANLALARRQLPAAVKAVAMIGVVGLAYGADFAVTAAILHSRGSHNATAPEQPRQPQAPLISNSSPTVQPPSSSPPVSSGPRLLTGIPGVTISTSVISEAGVQLSWPAYTPANGDSAAELLDYQVYRGTSPSFAPSASTLVSSVPAGITGFVDTAEPPITTADARGRTCYYMVAIDTPAGLIPGSVRPVRLATQIAIPAIAANTLAAAKPSTVLSTLPTRDGPQQWVDVGDDDSWPETAWEGANRAVFGFGGLSAIPAGALITDAHLSLWQADGYVNDIVPYQTHYQVHALTRSFTGSQTNWNRASNGKAWSHPGADYAPAATAEAPHQGDLNRLDFDTTAIVRGWFANPATEHGLLLKGVDEKTIQLHALFDGVNPLDPAHTPKLIVTYLPETLATTYDAPDTPQTMQPGNTATVPVTITNTTAAPWPAGVEALAWHWTAPNGTKAATAQAALPHDVPPGETVTIDVPLTAPLISGGKPAGQYTLAWDLFNKTTRSYLSARIGTFDQKIGVA